MPSNYLLSCWVLGDLDAILELAHNTYDSQLFQRKRKTHTYTHTNRFLIGKSPPPPPPLQPPPPGPRGVCGFQDSRELGFRAPFPTPNQTASLPSGPPDSGLCFMSCRLSELSKVRVAGGAEYLGWMWLETCIVPGQLEKKATVGFHPFT